MSSLQPGGTALTRFVSDGWVTTKRNLLKIKRVPDILVFTLIQPIMFVLLFTYVYGGVIDIPGSSYAEFLMAGIFAQTVVFGSTYSGSAMAQDLKDGIIDRVRTLPMNPAAVLIGRTNGDMVINASSMAVMIITGLIVGWRVRSSFGEAVVAVLLILFFAYAFSWVMACIGLVVPTPEVVNNASFMVLFPMTFIANTFVPSDNLPGALRTIAEWNPVSTLTHAVRERFGNIPAETPDPTSWPLQNSLLYSLLWAFALIIVFAPIATRLYRRAGAR